MIGGPAFAVRPGAGYPSPALPGHVRRGISPGFVVAIIVVIAVGGAGIIFLLRPGDKGGPGAPPEASAETPEFDFEVDRLTTIPTAGKFSVGEKPTAEDEKTAAKIAETMSLFYKAAFLDPANWKEGKYDSFYEFFESKTAGAARDNADILTAGSDAGGTYEDIQPEVSHLNVKLLTDDNGKTRTAVAIVEFRAIATEKSGGDTPLVSIGQFFLNPVGDGWAVYAFEVDRADGGKAVASPGPSKDKDGGNAEKKSPEP